MKDLRSRFGFHSTPFTRELPVDHCLAFPQYDDALDALSRVVNRRMSAALIAPAGTGKTTLLRRLVARLPEARYRVHYVKVTSLSKRDMCREIARAVGAQPAGSYPMLVQRLQEHFLAAADGDGLRPVLVLDEAHDMLSSPGYLYQLHPMRQIPCQGAPWRHSRASSGHGAALSRPPTAPRSGSALTALNRARQSQRDATDWWPDVRLTGEVRRDRTSSAGDRDR